MTSPRELQNLYQQGVNITQHLRQTQGLERNTDAIIEIAYDLQAGSYIAAMADVKMAQHKKIYSAEIAKVILSLCEPSSVLEAGVGEATTLSGVLAHLNPTITSYGFDLSWSRTALAQRWLHSQNIKTTTLCTGNLLNIPFADNAIDVVYTSHSMEPNGGKETPILQELYRVAKKYVVLLEPTYELANNEARQRMVSHGYCRNLTGVAAALGYEVMHHGLFPLCANPLNPTGLTIIKKPDLSPLNNAQALKEERMADQVLACPKYKTPLKAIDGMLFSPEALVAYPIVGGIPCLRIDNGIFASHFLKMNE
ncbi:MAG: methyltransferase domain-containing protein [Marinagarivorans sp.]|nr:methyltransferase domain-containing protein [Marinagarivorans sp.]